MQKDKGDITIREILDHAVKLRPLINDLEYFGVMLAIRSKDSEVNMLYCEALCAALRVLPRPDKLSEDDLADRLEREMLGLPPSGA